ncbi:MAG TPA: RHS repeat-associated core domain-containing protein [Chlamydiales bacterium]|nr:RHS repeat-associated core domain-containing protein [Chlamydiales bacterium]
MRSIRTTNADKTKEYARAQFVYKDPKRKNKNFYITGSDGQTVEYLFEDKQFNSLKRVVRSGLPDQSLHFTDFEIFKNVKEHRLDILAYPLQRKTCIDYYKKNEEAVVGQMIKMKDQREDIFHGNQNMGSRLVPDFRRGLVKTISSPIGTVAELHPTHSIIYNETWWTSVFDPEKKRTDYYNDGTKRLARIERFSSDGVLQNGESYAWSSQQNIVGNLLAKSLFDANGTIIFSTSYMYDGKGNICEEKFYGNLSGCGISPKLDKNNFPVNNGAECFTKRYTYSDGSPNLLIKEEHETGLAITYSYLGNTDLMTSQLTYDKNELKLRKFWEYTDGILTREIFDDGDSIDPANFSNVTVRTIREITPYNTTSYIGLPKIIEEKYWEKGFEYSLGKVILYYGTAAKIVRKEIYDAHGMFRYTLEMKYDEKGFLKSEKDALGRESIYDYDALGNRIYSKDFSGRTDTTIDYDFSNRPHVVSKKGDDGIILNNQLSYNSLHQLRVETDPQGHKTYREYDSLGRCNKIELPQIPTENGSFISPTLQKIFDAAGNEILSIDARGDKTITSYNAYGKPISVTYPDGCFDQYVYSLDGYLKSHTDSNGVVVSYKNDFLGRVLEKTVTSPFGILIAQELYEYKGNLLLSKTDAEKNVIKFTYDGAGRKIAEEINGEKTIFAYDSLGRIHETQKGELVQVTEYDLLNRVIEERGVTISGELLRKVQYEYDSSGNKKTITRFVAGENVQECFVYDSQNRLLKKTDPLGYFETISYDDFFVDGNGQKVLQKTHTDSLGLQTIETYNTHHKSASIEKRKSKTLALEEKIYHPGGQLFFQTNTIYNPDNTFRKVKTRWDYDNRARLQTLTEAAMTSNSKITKYSYTPTGEVKTITKPNGILLTYGYNDLRLNTSITSSDGTVNHHMHYNRLGHLIQSDNISRNTDVLGRVLTENFSQDFGIKHEYDASGRRASCQIPVANVLIEYDYLGNDLKRVGRKTSEKVLLYEHTYGSHDLSGNLLEENLINGEKVSYTIDPLSRKTGIASNYFSQEVLNFDPVGNIRKMHIQNQEMDYTYDDLYQLTSESGLFAHNYQYDSLNNRLQKDEESFQMNDLNQVVSHLEYDENGNPKRQGDTYYIYDALDRLINILTPDFSHVYTYDSMHRRLSQTILQDGKEQIRYFLYDGNNEIGVFNSNLCIEELRILGSTPHAEIGAAVAIELNNQVYAPVHDLQGNVATLLPLDPKEPLSSYRYSAFGEEKLTGSIVSPWRFSSKRTDETGLVYFGRRYYTPQLGRWLTPDPSGFTDGMNLYAFVHNDPLTHWDEYGLEDYGLFAQALKRDQDVRSYLLGSYKFENHYHHYTPQSYSPVQSTNKPLGEIVVFTGIRTTGKEHVDTLRDTSSRAGNVPIHGMHMPTHGFFNDLIKCDATFTTGMNSTIRHAERYFQEASQRVGADGKILALAHSAGSMNLFYSACAHLASKRLPQEIRDKIMIRTIAPAKIIPDEGFHSVTNIKSSGFDLLMLYHQIFHNKEYTHALKSGLLKEIPAHPSMKWGHDHGIMSPTFEGPIGDELRNFSGTYDCR